MIQGLFLAGFVSLAPLARGQAVFPHFPNVVIIQGRFFGISFTVEGQDTAAISLDQFKVTASNTILLPTSAITWQNVEMVQADESWRAKWVDLMEGPRMYYRVREVPAGF